MSIIKKVLQPTAHLVGHMKVKGYLLKDAAAAIQNDYADKIEHEANWKHEGYLADFRHDIDVINNNPTKNANLYHGRIVWDGFTLKHYWTNDYPNLR